MSGNAFLHGQALQDSRLPCLRHRTCKVRNAFRCVLAKALPHADASMTDRLGDRLKIGIVIPSTNTTVQPETDSMRPVGVTNHIGRIHIPDLPLSNDTEFEAMVEAIGPDLFQCVDRVMTCKPAHLIMAMSIPTFWGGKAAARHCLHGCRIAPAFRSRWVRMPAFMR